MPTSLAGAMPPSDVPAGDSPGGQGRWEHLGEAGCSPGGAVPKHPELAPNFISSHTHS